MSIGKRPNVIQEVINASEKGLLILSLHAEKQMLARNIQMSDVEEMLYRAQRESHKDTLRKDGKDWKYSLRGLNANGDKDLRIIVVFNTPDTVVITVIDKYRKET
jgi:hypothetical protein